MTTLPLLVALVIGGLATAAGSPGAAFPYRVVDRRSVDGSVLLVDRLLRDRPGEQPFIGADLWELTPATEWYELRGLTIQARAMKAGGDPPKTIVEGGAARPGPFPDLLGIRVDIGPGEPLRLVDINAALGTIRVDLETVCRNNAAGLRYRGRISFSFEGQVTKKSLAPANAVVGRYLRPMPLNQVAEHCNPYQGSPPIALRPGDPVPIELLGEPLSRVLKDKDVIWSYGLIELGIRDGLITSIGIPALDG